METLLDSDEIKQGPPTRFAGFWIRFFAYIIDSIVMAGIFAVIFAIIAVVLGVDSFSRWMGDPATSVSINGLSFIVGLAYFVWMESSEKQATVGKMAMGIIVVDDAGRRLTPGRAAGRYLGKIISSIILLIGFIMVAFHEKKKGLHDVMANTLVIYK